MGANDLFLILVSFVLGNLKSGLDVRWQILGILVSVGPDL